MTTAKFFIDSNIFLRTVFHDQEKQTQDCINLLDSINQGKFKAITSNLVIAEIAWTATKFYKSPKHEVLLLLNTITSVKNLKIIDQINTKLALDIYTKHNIKFIDALLASNPNIQNHKINLISYDKEFDKLKILRKEPEELIKH